MVASNPSSPNTHLDNAQSMLNLIFIQCGRLIKETQAKNGTGRQRLAMQQATPAATEHFHDALDELENEVRLAQMVLRRDLALLRKDRRKREAAAKRQEDERTKLAIEAKNAPTDSKEDVVMKTETANTPDLANASVPRLTSSEAKDEGLKLNETSASSAPLALNTTSANTERDPLFDGTPTTANPQDTELDFDAIFGTGDDVDPIHISTDGKDISTSDLPFHLVDNDTNESPSLLRGLEDFAKAGEDDTMNMDTVTDTMDIDFSIPDLPHLDSNLTSIPPGQQRNETEADGKEKVREDEAKDDSASALVSADDGIMTTTASDSLGEWFNIEDYQMQEISSFDDAFSNFE